MILLITGLSSCKKEEGPGGKAHIVGRVFYQSQPVNGGTVYIWYGETNVSDVSAGYDDQQTCNATGDFEFHDLYKGNYFLHAVYTDTSATVRKGSLAVTIKGKSETIQPEIIVQ